MARGSPDPGLSCCSGEGPRTLPGLPLRWRTQWAVTWGVVNSGGVQGSLGASADTEVSVSYRSVGHPPGRGLENPPRINGRVPSGGWQLRAELSRQLWEPPPTPHPARNGAERECRVLKATPYRPSTAAPCQARLPRAHKDPLSHGQREGQAWHV